MPAEIPSDALDRATPVVEELHALLQEQLKKVEPGPNSAIRFVVVENHK